LGDLGFEGPFKGSGYDYVIRGITRITMPNVHKGKDIGARLLVHVLKEAKIDRDDPISST